MKKIIFMVLLFVSLPCSVVAEGFKTEIELRQFADKFMDQVID